MQEAGVNLAGPMEILLAGNAIHTVLKRLQALIKVINVSKMHAVRPDYPDSTEYQFPYMDWESGTSADFQMALEHS